MFVLFLHPGDLSLRDLISPLLSLFLLLVFCIALVTWLISPEKFVYICKKCWSVISKRTKDE
jgi:hypothetical protein